MQRQAVLSVKDAQLTAKWASYFQDWQKAAIHEIACDYPERTSLTLSLRDIELHDPDLCNYTLQKPDHSLRLAVTALNAFDVTVDPRPVLALRVRGLPENSHIVIRDIRSVNLGELRGFDGVIRKATGVKSRFMEAVFECKVCTTRMYIVQDDEQLAEPPLCETCDAQRPVRLIVEESRMVNAQRIQLEELTETMELPSQPRRIQGYVVNDDILNNEHLLNQVGSRVRCTCIITLLPPKKHEGKSVEREFMLRILDVEPLDESNARIKLSEEDIAAIEAAAKDPKHISNLVGSLATGLKGLNIEKEALMLAVFGGVEKPVPGHHMRGDIHLLFCGDPSTGKSKLLKAAQAIVPRSVFTSGKGSSAAGLTAAVIRDDFDGQYTLEPGALPLADMGIVFADELDKMDQNDQSALHQGLEDQEVSINKGGISATLKTRCAVIGASNPKLGRFDQYSPLIEQIDLTPPLLSRFDVIFTMIERVNKDEDRQKATHIAHMHRVGQQRIARRRGRQTQAADEEEKPPYDVPFLRKFITYAKANVFPLLTPAAEEHLTTYYLHLRSPDVKSIAITTRQYEGLIRLSEASARMSLSQEVRVEDAQRAIKIYQEFMTRVGVDRETGAFDIDAVAGVSHSQHDRMRIIVDIVRSLAREAPGKYTREDDVVAEASRQGIVPEQARKALEMALRNNSVFAKGGRGTFAPLSDTPPLATPQELTNRIKLIQQFIRTATPARDGVPEASIIDYMQGKATEAETRAELQRMLQDGAITQGSRHDHYRVS